VNPLSTYRTLQHNQNTPLVLDLGPSPPLPLHVALPRNVRNTTDRSDAELYLCTQFVTGNNVTLFDGEIDVPRQAAGKSSLSMEHLADCWDVRALAQTLQPSDVLQTCQLNACVYPPGPGRLSKFSL